MKVKSWRLLMELEDGTVHDLLAPAEIKDAKISIRRPVRPTGEKNGWKTFEYTGKFLVTAKFKGRRRA